MQITVEHLAIIMFAIMIIGVIWMPATWLALSILTPRSLLDRYFKEPYFTVTETVMMKMFPGFLLRTAMFGWSLYFPNLGKKRGIINPGQYMPFWYAAALRVFIAGVAISGLGIFGLMGFLMLLPESYGPEHVLFTIPTF